MRERLDAVYRMLNREIVTAETTYVFETVVYPSDGR